MVAGGATRLAAPAAVLDAGSFMCLPLPDKTASRLQPDAAAYAPVQLASLLRVNVYRCTMFHLDYYVIILRRGGGASECLEQNR
jgi:hypothetical protein